MLSKLKRDQGQSTIERSRSKYNREIKVKVQCLTYIVKKKIKSLKKDQRFTTLLAMKILFSTANPVYMRSVNSKGLV